jgi:hypothetical protein
MAMGTNHMSDTTLAAQIPEIWGKMINNFYQEELVMARFFTDRSDELSDGGDTIYTPNITEMTAYSKTNGSQVTLNALGAFIKSLFKTYEIKLVS